jgi:hypothetical protein
LAAALAVLLFVAPATAQETAADQVVADRVQAWLRANSRPAIAVLRELPGANPSATSWFGGLPRMPEELEWPRIDRGPMFLIAQIDLADLPENAPRGGLPSTGVLWFFGAFDEEWEFDVAVRYDPRSHQQWPERRPPRGMRRIVDAGPYIHLPEADPLAQHDLRSAMRFAPVDSYRLNSSTLDGLHVSQGLNAASTMRREQIEHALGRAARQGPRLGRPAPLDRDEWPFAGLNAELAAGALAEQLPSLEISRHAPAGSSWTREGRALRASFAREAEQQARRWRARRYQPLSFEERAEFRAWLASVKARAEAMPRTQTGGYSLVWDVLEHYVQDTDTFAALAMLAAGADVPALPPAFRTSFDWFGDDPPTHQMLGHAFSWQDGPVAHFRDVLLLQVEGGADTPWLPECMLHFWISPEALAARRFDRVSHTLECD